MSQLTWFFLLLCGGMTVFAIALQIVAAFSSGNQWFRDGVRNAALYVFLCAVFIAVVWFGVLPLFQVVLRAPR